jgi:hypothetical protein
VSKVVRRKSREAGRGGCSSCGRRPSPDHYPTTTPAAALWWRILDQLPQTPNPEPATSNAVPAIRRATAPAPVPRLRPPPAFGPSR